MGWNINMPAHSSQCEFKKYQWKTEGYFIISCYHRKNETDKCSYENCPVRIDKDA